MKTLLWMVALTIPLIISPSFSQTYTNESVELSDTEIRAAYCVGVLRVTIDWMNKENAKEKESAAQTERYYLQHPQEQTQATLELEKTRKGGIADVEAGIQKVQSDKQRLTTYLIATGLLNNNDKIFGFTAATKQGSQDQQSCLD